MIKKIFTGVVCVVMLVTIGGVMSGCWGGVTEKNAKQKIESTFKTQLPKDAKIIYHYKNKSSVPTLYFTVFQLENEPTEYLIDNDFGIPWRHSDPEIEKMLKKAFEERYKTDNEEFCPDFTKEYLVKTFSVYARSATMIYFHEKMQLKIWYNL